MANLPFDPIPPVSATANPNADLPPDDFPSLSRIIVTDLVGPLAANGQERALEKRDEYLRSLIVKLVDGYNTLDTWFLRKNGSQAKDGIQGASANMPFNGFRPIGLGAPTAGDHGTNKTYVDGSVATEAGARAAADVTLQNNINAEASTRSGADTTLQNNINAEASTRSGADTTLQNNINAEALARGNADSAEVLARGNADTTLQNNINAEALTRGNADTSLQNQINLLSPSGYQFFTAVGTPTFTAPKTGWYRIIIVGSGAGAGGGAGPGGGAGEVRQTRAYLSVGQVVALVIPAGGLGAAGPDDSYSTGSPGAAASFGSISALGGLEVEPGWVWGTPTPGLRSPWGGNGGAWGTSPSGRGSGGGGGFYPIGVSIPSPAVDGEDYDTVNGGKAGQGFGAGGGSGGFSNSGTRTGNGGRGAQGCVLVEW